MAEGVEGVTHDKTCKPGKPPVLAATVQRVTDLALSAPPGEASRQTRQGPHRCQTRQGVKRTLATM
jgi:hypothetical protein